MDKPDYETFFQNYVEVFNRSLAAEVDTDAIRASYAEYFVSASTGGAVHGGANDEKYADILRQGYEFYKAIGLVKMSLLKVESSEIGDDHDMVKPFFRAEYLRKDGSPVTIDFDLAYMVQRREKGPKIFAFVAGDELALYRRHGLVNVDGKPA